MPDTFSLKKHSEIAQEIGFLIMLIANLEGWLEVALIEIFKGKHELAEAIFSRVDSISNKFEILVSVARARPTSPVSSAIIDSENDIRSAINYRNSLAHGIFEFDEKGRLCLATAVLNKKRGRPKEHQLTPSSIRTHSDRIGVFQKQISNLCSPSAFFLRHPRP
ncbi:hypothetical protein [Brucella intermedia]|uniref:hypothetical protein n=1 Tax=Brucella intermedia TaxID=94625 RepID=UPI00158EE652|nr:hypothetical protein [Brucella intermedia]NYD84309.1 hypothetical protein [Brucella intermedia]